MPLQPARHSDSSPPPPPRVPMKLWSITQWLIFANIAIYVIDILAYRRLDPWGGFSVQAAVFHLQLWRFLTFQFLHASPTHLFYNLITLYYFGTILEPRLQRLPFLVFYLLSGSAGALVYLLMWRLNLLHVYATSTLLGASAGIFGVMTGAATLEPQKTMTLWFPPVTIRLPTLVWIFLAIALIVLFTSGPNAGGQAAHLGGLAAGYLLVRHAPWFKRIAAGKSPRTRFWRPGDPRSNFFKEDFRK